MNLATLFSLFVFCYSSITLSKCYLVEHDNIIMSPEEEWGEFKNFQQKYNKFYENIEQFETRFKIFRTNLHTIHLHNSQNKYNFTLGVNHFADLTPLEFETYYTGGLFDLNDRSSLRGSSNRYGCKSFTTNNGASLPSSIDWRKKGAVTSVKDQGQCGSCWAFSSTAATEGAWAIATGNLVDLSEQELVDCAAGFEYGSHGCSGGQMDGGFKFVIENGLCTAAEYPYVSGTTKTEDSCKSSTCLSDVKNSAASCSDVTPNNEMVLKTAVSKQPVAVAIEADTKYFQFYSGGVLDSAECGTKLDHGVMIAGYGEEDGKKYWLVKNSWSASWGEDGYVKIGRSDSTNTNGICGIAMSPSFIEF